MRDDFDKWPCDAGHHDNCIGQIVDPSGATWDRCPCECHATEGKCVNRKVRFKRAQVKVATFEHGQRVLDQSVDALVLGDLAVHKPLQGGGFCVTHIPSGFKMAEAWKRRSCQELVTRLHALNIDWKFDATAPTESYYEKASPILREFNSKVNR